MELETLNQLILTSLKYYDQQCIDYFYLINTSDNTQLNQDISEITFFLDDNNPEQFNNVDYRQKVVSPMIALKDEFLLVIQKNVLFEDYGSCRTRPITRFGNEDEKGSFENILDENLSGVELRITLPINKSGNCKC